MIHTFKTPQNAWLSNMALVDVSLKNVFVIPLDERVYKSVEHAYQAAKSDHQEWKEFCMSTQSPYDVKRKSHGCVVRSDWNAIKVVVMESLLRQKFNTEIFRTLLLQTGEQNIQEGNTWGDRFWGVDLRNNPNIGENHLGRLIMKIRNELQDN